MNSNYILLLTVIGISTKHSYAAEIDIEGSVEFGRDFLDNLNNIKIMDIFTSFSLPNLFYSHTMKTSEEPVTENDDIFETTPYTKNKFNNKPLHLTVVTPKDSFSKSIEKESEDNLIYQKRSKRTTHSNYKPNSKGHLKDLVKNVYSKKEKSKDSFRMPVILTPFTTNPNLKEKLPIKSKQHDKQDVYDNPDQNAFESVTTKTTQREKHLLNIQKSDAKPESNNHLIVQSQINNILKLFGEEPIVKQDSKQPDTNYQTTTNKDKYDLNHDNIKIESEKTTPRHSQNRKKRVKKIKHDDNVKIKTNTSNNLLNFLRDEPQDKQVKKIKKHESKVVHKKRKPKKSSTTKLSTEIKQTTKNDYASNPAPESDENTEKKLKTKVKKNKPKQRKKDTKQHKKDTKQKTILRNPEIDNDKSKQITAPNKKNKTRLNSPLISKKTKILIQFMDYSKSNMKRVFQQLIKRESKEDIKQFIQHLLSKFSKQYDDFENEKKESVVKTVQSQKEIVSDTIDYVEYLFSELSISFKQNVHAHLEKKVKKHIVSTMRKIKQKACRYFEIYCKKGKNYIDLVGEVLHEFLKNKPKRVKSATRRLVNVLYDTDLNKIMTQKKKALILGHCSVALQENEESVFKQTKWLYDIIISRNNPIARKKLIASDLDPNKRKERKIRKFLLSIDDKIGVIDSKKADRWNDIIKELRLWTEYQKHDNKKSLKHIVDFIVKGISSEIDHKFIDKIWLELH